MANIKITDLTAYTDPAATDVLPIVDVGADVTKKVSIQDLLENAGSGTAAAPGIAFDGDSDTGIYRPGANQLALSTNGTGRLFVDASGNVGVGTSTPENYGSGFATLEARGLSGTAGGVFQTRSFDATIKGYFYVDSSTNTGRIGTVTNHPFLLTTNSQERLRITSAGQLSFIGAGSSGSPAVGFNGSAPSNSLVIDSTGKVGIGTSAPSQLLTLQQTSAGSAVDCLFLNNSSSSNGTAVGISFGPNTANDITRSAIIRGINESGGAGNATGLGFFTNANGAAPTQKVTITSGGSVGIGTTSPAKRLHVVGDSNGSITSGESAIRAYSADSTAYLSLQYDGIDGTIASNPSAAKIAIGINGTERARIDSSGRLGLGTSSPSSTLDVTGTARISSVLTMGSYIQGTTQLDLYGNSSSSSGLRLDSSGRVGIGTTSPSQLLDVNGDAEINGLTVGRGPGNIASNVAFGSNALLSNTTGSFNIAVGVDALRSNSTAGNNIAIGSRALYTNNGDYNSAIGRDALFDNTSGTSNSAFGFYSLSNNTTGINNTGLGTRTLFANSTGSNNIAIGNGAGDALTTGSNNTIIGDIAGTAGLSDTVIIGAGATERLRIDSSGRLLVGTSTSRSVAIGTSAGWQAQNQIASTSISNIGLSLFSWSTYSTDLGGGAGVGPDIVLARSNSNSEGTQVAVTNGMLLGRINFNGSDGTAFANGAYISAASDGQTWASGDCPARLVFSVTADGAASPTEALRISSNRAITVSDGGNVVLGTTTGTKIGTSTSQKIGFFDETPIVQPTTGIAEAAFVENSGGTAVNVDSTFGGYTIQQVVQALQSLGLLA